MFVRILLQLHSLNKALYKSNKQIKQEQQEKCIAMVRYAYEKVPFYKEKFDTAGVDVYGISSLNDFKRLPITTKEELAQQPVESLLAKGYSTKNTIASRTSGSTGLPFTTYFDKRSWSLLRYASKLRARRFCGMDWSDKVAIIEPYSPEEVTAINKNIFKSFFFRKKVISLYESINKNIATLEAFGPKVLYGNSSYFLELIEHLPANHGIRPTKIFTSAELLDSKTRTAIESAFACPLYDIYGSTEVKEVAWQCLERKGYHINEDLYVVEMKEDLLDGEILVTALENKAMPLIRFSIGDRGKLLQENCSCELAFACMNPSLGRDVNYFTLKNGKRIAPYTITTALEDIKGILQYKVVQKKKSLVWVYVRKNTQYKESTREHIVHNLKDLLGKNMEIFVKLVTKIPREKSGKYFVVKSEVTS